MKSLVLIALLSMSVSAFAGALKTNEAVLTEIQTQQLPSCTPEAGNSCDTRDTAPADVKVSFTRLFANSEIDMNFKLDTTAPTLWINGAALLDVKGVTLEYGAQEGKNARVTIWQADGNNMGSTQINVVMNCSRDIEAFRCLGALTNHNRVYLVIGR